MQKIIHSIAAIALLAISSNGLAGDCSKQDRGGEVIGTLLGAALGGLVGSQIGGGTGNKIAIGAGVLAGGFAGNKIGSSMDCRDQQYHGRTAQTAFEHEQSGTTSDWQNPDTGHYGSVTPTRTYQRQNGTYCREFTQSVTIDGQSEQAHGTACRQPDTTWKIVSG